MPIRKDMVQQALLVHFVREVIGKLADTSATCNKITQQPWRIGRNVTARHTFPSFLFSARELPVNGIATTGDKPKARMSLEIIWVLGHAVACKIIGAGVQAKSEFAELACDQHAVVR
jgi:hypothetical protein